jgi:hypothetical protein
VFITDRGKPAHVLLSIEDYQRITGGHRKIADALVHGMTVVTRNLAAFEATGVPLLDPWDASQ